MVQGSYIKKINWVAVKRRVKVKSESRSVVSDSLQLHGLYSPWNSPGKNIGVGSLSFLQGIFQTQGLNPCLLHWQADSLPLSHQGSPTFQILDSKQS